MTTITNAGAEALMDAITAHAVKDLQRYGDCSGLDWLEDVGRLWLMEKGIINTWEDYFRWLHNTVLPHQLDRINRRNDGRKYQPLTTYRRNARRG